jgi:hypothetical protein
MIGTEPQAFRRKQTSEQGNKCLLSIPKYSFFLQDTEFLPQVRLIKLVGGKVYLHICLVNLKRHDFIQIYWTTRLALQYNYVFETAEKLNKNTNIWARTLVTHPGHLDV